MEDIKPTGKVANPPWCRSGPGGNHEWNQDTRCCKHCGDRYPTSDEGFEIELRHILNRYSRENASDTPDFILCQYLLNCLNTWNMAIQQRETWYGRDARPASQPIIRN